jgi:hypothetical protein
MAELVLGSLNLSKIRRPVRNSQAVDHLLILIHRPHLLGYLAHLSALFGLFFVQLCCETAFV